MCHPFLNILLCFFRFTTLYCYYGFHLPNIPLYFLLRIAHYLLFSIRFSSFFLCFYVNFPHFQWFPYIHSRPSRHTERTNRSILEITVCEIHTEILMCVKTVFFAFQWHEHREFIHSSYMSLVIKLQLLSKNN
jgi:hypothetical protein